MISAQPSTHEPVLGIGRAAVVFKSSTPCGRATARKVFTSDALTRLVQYVFLGAPNPYAWCEHAVQAAILRRRILAPLVSHWSGGDLRVAAGWSVDWDNEHLAWQLHTEFIEGRAPALAHPLRKDADDEVQALRECTRSLVEHLCRAGFDGQAWQAGLGNPVALSNFLLEELPGGRRRYAWIDLESGVPALFPAHLPSLWRFYLPCAFRYGRPLFDDVDTARLTTWLSSEEQHLSAHLGRDVVEGIKRDVVALEYHQGAWRGMSRLTRSVRSQLAKDRITEEQACSYEQAPVRWYARETLRAARGLTRRAAGRLGKLSRVLIDAQWRRLARSGTAFLFSHRFRTALAERFVTSRLKLWEARGQLESHQATSLQQQLGQEESSVYLADFGVHLAVKPFVKSFEYIVSPALFAAGVIDAVTLSMIMMSGGSVGRTVYTSGRLIQNLLRGRELPWTALWIGLIPVIGNLAFPLQIVRSGREDEDTIARFILYDGCSVIGRRLPIWGGMDTLTEHWFNRLPNHVVRT